MIKTESILAHFDIFNLLKKHVDFELLTGEFLILDRHWERGKERSFSWEKILIFSLRKVKSFSN